jgi:hypothetical protein
MSDLGKAVASYVAGVIILWALGALLLGVGLTLGAQWLYRNIDIEIHWGASHGKE